MRLKHTFSDFRSSTDALHLMALAAAILALGAVYWLVRDTEPKQSRIKH